MSEICFIESDYICIKIRRHDRGKSIRAPRKPKQSKPFLLECPTYEKLRTTLNNDSERRTTTLKHIFNDPANTDK